MDNMITYREGYCTDNSEGIKLFDKYDIDYKVDESRGRLCGHSKTVIAINAGPGKGRNTDKLILAAGKGAETTGATVEYISLYQLEKFTGCISCFSCKKEKTFGKINWGRCWS